MPKFSLPMKVVASSGGFLVLLALGSLLVMSDTVQTSGVEHQLQEVSVAPQPINDEFQAVKQIEQIRSVTPEHANDEAKQYANGPPRQRSGRLYQQASQPLDSYAAAYAAVNPEEQTSNHQQQQQQQSVAVQQTPTSSINDAGAYASFGETPPQAQSIASATMARQLQANLSPEYSPQSSYYASYMSPSSSEASYSGAGGQFGPIAGSYYSPVGQHHGHHNNHHYKSQSSAVSLPLGYPTNAYERSPSLSSGYYDRVAHHQAASSPFFSTSSFNSGGLMSSASHALSHWTNGFSIGEIICGLVALSIGAVILGAPFFLIYLALMGNFSGSGTLSLTNPTSASAATGGASATINGRRKRLAVFETMNQDEQVSKHPDLATMVDSMVKQLSPLVDLQRVSRTFKHLISSIDKYAPASKVGNSRSTDSAKRKSS